VRGELRKKGAGSEYSKSLSDRTYGQLGQIYFDELQKMLDEGGWGGWIVSIIDVDTGRTIRKALVRGGRVFPSSLITTTWCSASCSGRW
jgi:hypothetical protein